MPASTAESPPSNRSGQQSGLHFGTALLPGGWARDVRIECTGGVISRVESGVAPLPGDERAPVGLPGVPNAHSHAFQRGMAGLTEKRISATDSFWSWRQLMYQFVSRLTPEDLEALAAQAYVEMLEAGFTRVCEFHYVHHDVRGGEYANPAEMAERIVAAASQVGIGLTLLPVFYAHGGFGGAQASAHQARFLSDVPSYAKLIEASRVAVRPLGDAVVGIAPHSLRAVSPGELQSILPLAAGGPVHIHVAEQLREVEECQAALGARPVEWLLDRNPVDSRWCLVHATHVLPHEVMAFAESGAVAGLCPITEANLGDGVFPAVDFQRGGGHYAVGSDSNVLISLSEELRLLEYGQRLRDGARKLLATQEKSTGRAIFDAVLAGGTQAAGVQAEAGIHVGASADIVSLRDDLALTGRSEDQILDTFIFADSRGLIDCVWRAGRKVVSGGVHLARAPVAARFRAALQRLVGA
jgi:formimidoylglutamate deiminase